MNRSAVLLLNLGSPDSTKVSDVRRYLKEFLGDPRVLDGGPKLLLKFVLNCLILPFRPKASAEAYSKIWTDAGSPLMVISESQQRLLAERLDVPVELAMRYGSCSVEAALERLKAQGVNRIFMMPLYPHYAMSSYETVVVKVEEAAKRILPQAQLDLLQPFYKDADYIDALVQSAQPYLEDFDKLLFSFHGIPQRHLEQTDPSHAHCFVKQDCCSNCNPAHATCYRHQCFQTVEHFLQRSGLRREQIAVSFQSRLGREPWLEPYTDDTLKALPKKGVKRLLVICPAFISDCLETLEEISMTGKEDFLEAGGEYFEQIPCLNDQAPFIDFLEGRAKAWLNAGKQVSSAELLASV